LKYGATHINRHLVRLAQQMITYQSIGLDTFYPRTGERPRVCARRLLEALREDSAFRIIITARDSGSQDPANFLLAVIASAIARSETELVHYQSAPFRNTQAEAVILRRPLLGSDQAPGAASRVVGDSEPRRDRCPSKKRMFPTSRAAEEVAAQAATRRGHQRINSSYHCRECGAWHLTSQESPLTAKFRRDNDILTEK